MPRRVTKIHLSSQLFLGQAYARLAENPGDLAATITTNPVAPWLAAIGDLNGDGKAELIIGASGNDASGTDAGRVYVDFGHLTDGTTSSLYAPGSSIVINGAKAGDHAGAAVGTLSDINGDGLSEILVGAPRRRQGYTHRCGRGLCRVGTKLSRNGQPRVGRSRTGRRICDQRCSCRRCRGFKRDVRWRPER
jgi:hypothetical protein